MAFPNSTSDAGFSSAGPFGVSFFFFFTDAAISCWVFPPLHFTVCAFLCVVCQLCALEKSEQNKKKKKKNERKHENRNASDWR